MVEIVGWFGLLLTLASTVQFDLETCRVPLGVESGQILDSAFSSSSDARESSVASQARIRSETDGWCPSKKISLTTYEYIQIDLVNLTVLTLVEIQGKFSLQPNEEFADAFRIEYRRNVEGKWMKYKDFSGRYMLSGNSNSYIPTIRDILPSIIARQIRIIPMVTGPISKCICMRLELYGCSYREGLISYTIPQGDQRGYDRQFLDDIYDGQNDNGLLKGGLGQLTDGILAEDDDYHFNTHVRRIDPVASSWLGWKRKSSDVNLVFHFDTIRKFSSIRIHTSNYFPYQIYQCHSITIATCANLGYAKHVLIPNDYTNSSARFLQISFTLDQQMLSDCLTVRLTFNTRSKWMLISEVQFDSVSLSVITPESITINSWIFPTIIFITLLLTFLVVMYIHSSQTNEQTPPLKRHSRPNQWTCLSSHRLNANSWETIDRSSWTSTTMSTIYQSSLNTLNLTINPYSSVDISPSTDATLPKG